MRGNLQFLGLFAISCCALWWGVGCGGGVADAPDLGSVDGTVTFNGEPLSNATVSFYPKEGGRTSTGTTDEKGYYELSYIRDDMGAKIGKSEVSVTTQSEAVYDEETGDNLIQEAQPESIPAIYNDETTLEFEVASGRNTYDIVLEGVRTAKPPEDEDEDDGDEPMVIADSEDEGVEDDGEDVEEQQTSRSPSTSDSANPGWSMVYILIGIVVLFLVIWGMRGKSKVAQESDQQVPVAGTVKYNGEWIKSGVISFVPLETDRAKASGFIVAGDYSIREEKGPHNGKYRVKISWLKNTGKEVEELDEDGNPTGSMVLEKRELIPAKYNKESELTVELTTGPNTHDFDLKP